MKLGAFVTGPFFHGLGILSIFEYFEKRYGDKRVRLMANVSYLLRSLMSSAIIQLGPMPAVSIILGLDTGLVIVFIGLLGTCYTSLGGIKGVIWCDLFQAVIMIVTVVTVAVKGAMDVGGVENVMLINQQGGRLNWINLDPDPFVRMSFWSLTLGASTYFAINYCFDQQMLQRFKACKTQRQAQLALLLNIPIVFVYLSTCCFIGLVIYAHFHSCDLFYSSRIANVNQYSSYLVANSLKTIPGVVGLFVAAVFSSALSSLSSTLNSMTLVIWEDVFTIWPRFSEMKESKKLFVNKLIVCFCGLLSTLVCYSISFVPINLAQLNNVTVGVFNALLVGLFLMSMLFSCVNKYGAMTGTVAGLAVSLWISGGALIMQQKQARLDLSLQSCPPSNSSNVYSFSFYNQTDHSIRFSYESQSPGGLFDKIYTVSFFYYTLIGSACSILVALLVSLLTGGLRNQVDSKLIIYDLSGKFKLPLVSSRARK